MRYCSVVCFRSHKDTPSCKGTESASDSQKQNTPTSQLSSADCQRLAQDEELRALLASEQIQEQFNAILSAPDQQKALEELMTTDPELHKVCEVILKNIKQ